MNKIIVQVAIPGPENKRVDGFKYIDDLYKLSQQQAQAYANICGADYMVITDKNFLPEHSAPYQRLQFFDLPHDQILYLDADAIVQPGAPDIFELYKDSWFSAPRDYPWDKKKDSHLERQQEIQKLLNADDSYRPFCSGVMLMRKDFIDYGKNQYRNYLHYGSKYSHDQGIMNQIIVNSALGFTELDERWGVWYTAGEYIDHLGGPFRKIEFNLEKYLKKMNKKTAFGALFE